MCDLCGEDTKEEVEPFVAKYSLKSACTASTDRSSSCASDLRVACGPGGLTALGMREWFLLASLELSIHTPYVSTKGT